MTPKLAAFLGSESSALWAHGDKLIASASGGFPDYSFGLFPFANTIPPKHPLTIAVNYP